MQVGSQACLNRGLLAGQELQQVAAVVDQPVQVEGDGRLVWLLAAEGEELLAISGDDGDTDRGTFDQLAVAAFALLHAPATPALSERAASYAGSGEEEGPEGHSTCSWVSST